MFEENNESESEGTDFSDLRVQREIIRNLLEHVLGGLADLQDTKKSEWALGSFQRRKNERTKGEEGGVELELLQTDEDERAKEQREPRASFESVSQTILHTDPSKGTREK